jgi:tetratricopeptide (TPR) repeat protein
MLLLDFWPLRRFQLNPQHSTLNTLPPLLLEKLPFLLLTALACAVTLWAQGREHAIITVQRMPLNYRVANAVLSCYAYVGKTLWPTRLAVFYPHGHATLTWPILIAGAGLVLISAAFLWLRRFPCLAVGWLWFMGTLVPVIGLVQVGEQAMADRYTYIPSIGLFILVVFSLSDLAGRARLREAAMTVLASLALVACLITTRQQLGYWRSSEALYRHALAVTEGNYIADNNLAVDLFKRDHAEEAVGFYLTALRYAPNYADAHANLGNAYAKLKRRREAIAEYRVALRLDPNLARTHYYLANELLGDGDATGAEAHYQASLALGPDHPEAHYQLAIVLQARGEVAAATQHFHQALRLKPDWIEALNNLAWLLATQPEARFRDGKQALELASRAVALTHTNEAGPLDTLGGALAEVGRFTEAANTARTAARLAQAAGAADLEREIAAHLQCYEHGVPVRESGTATNAPANHPGRSRAGVGPPS